MLPSGATYEEIRDRFRWEVPELYNIGVDVCDRWAAADPERSAIIHVDLAGQPRRLTYAGLRARSNQLANVLRARGIARGDRIGVLLPQAPETAYAHIASYKLGAIAVPLFPLFGPEALEYRLGDAGVRALITNADGLAKLRAIKQRLPALEWVFSIDGPAEGAIDLHAELLHAPAAIAPVATRADDPALIIYTSGTTGMPKGALHAHRVLLGHLPGVEVSHNFLPQPGDCLWTPADWAWIGGLLDVLLPALHHGIPVVAHRFAKFSGEAAFGLIRDLAIRNAFIPPTALKMMRAASLRDPSLNASMRSVASGGETLGAELLEWGRSTFGVEINEFYGQTECNMVVSSCGAVMHSRPGVMGRPVPGHTVSIVDGAGAVCAEGEPGSIAVRRGDPVMFLGYWRNPAATEAKFIGDWLITGDVGILEPGGWIRFLGRDDDLITSSGYRIGPGEIEDCLLRHPSVQMAGVVGKPDAERTEIVKAFVVLKDGVEPSSRLAVEIGAFVKERLAAHEYPREIAFVDALPMTTTGKIIRRELRAIAPPQNCFRNSARMNDDDGDRNTRESVEKMRKELGDGMARRLEGKVAMVIGAGSIGPGWGNGKAISVLFAREGAHVFCVDVNAAAAKETVGLIEAEDGRADAWTADATSGKEVAALVDECVRRHGRIDVLCNNIGVVEVGGVVELSEETWDRVFDINLKTCFLAMKHVIPHMVRQGGGSIVNISSISSIRYTGVPYATYSATKAAMNHLTRTTAAEYAGRQVRVNAVLPGLMKTPMVEKSVGLAKSYGGGDANEMWRVRDAQCPMGHMGDAWDVANAALFLASSEARYVTGVELLVDGGITLKYG